MEAVQARRAFKKVPPPTQEVGQGLPALKYPQVPLSKLAWLEQLDKLECRPGADVAKLQEVRSWILHGVKASFAQEEPLPENTKLLKIRGTL